jgi:hypothetical protein
MLLFKHIQVKPDFKVTIMRGIVLFAGITFLTSVVQYFLYPNIRNIAYLGWDPHWYRMVGLFFDPPITGAVYGLLFIFVYVYLKKIPFAIWIAVLFALFVGILLTYSRGTFLGFAVISLFLIFRKRIVMGIGIISIVLILSFVFLPKPFGESVNLLRTFSIFSRISNYQEALSLWQKQPIQGVGYNRIRYARNSADFENEEDRQSNHAGASFHSSFLITLVTGGIIGFGLFVWVLYSLGKISLLAGSSIAFLSILSLTDNVLLHPFVLPLLLLYALL